MNRFRATSELLGDASILEESARGPESVRIGHLERVVHAAQEYLFGIQEPDGHWRARLEGDSILESEYVLLMHFLGRAGEPKVRKAADYLRRAQMETGGWAHYHGGPAEVSASVKAYFVLKLMGDRPEDPHMVRAREMILRAGGIEACNSFTRIYLAIFGQYPWSRCPAVPPEMMLLPRWSPLHIYRMSAWSRTIVVPLSMIWAHRPSVAVPEEASIAELFVPGRAPTMDLQAAARFWRLLFTGLDVALKGIEELPVKPLRERGLREAERWILKRLDKSDGLGAIFPPIINTILALRCHGYAADHPVIQSQVAELEKLELEDEKDLRIQPCLSPVWDTALTMNALLGSGISGEDPRLLSGARWLLEKEVRETGDWAMTCEPVAPGGWYFEYANEFYPDLDDTTQVLSVLGRIRFPDPEEDRRRTDAMRRGLDWMRAMQNADGGWAAFDRGCDSEFLTHVPFADHNAMIDPSCEDITGRALETFSLLRPSGGDAAVQRAGQFLLRRQEADGTWYGRWGCNYLYGTWLAVHGLTREFLPSSDARIQRAVAWVRSRQNADGGWGELPRSYDDPSTKGDGPSTAAQTAWAVLTLLAAGDHTSASLVRGITYLLETQRADGSWYDEAWTGTGFPRVFYLKYHLYATYFPLLALGTYREKVTA